ncbi:MFS transporter [Solirubrobacter soli]|uniref:MFS transporter n=1 Tax=Solirubrobacter soli TaxID=363832 RepID=UPI00041F03B3|nr:MFS transporter [Solirubrobacter soli]
MLRSALATPAARRFFAAHAQSSLGTGLALLALPLIALDRFGSPMAVSAVLLPDLLPAIVLGPLVGALVDRVGWRRCAVFAEVLRCLGFVIVVVAGSLPVMMVGALLAGVGSAVFSPAALASLTRLAGGERRAAALAVFGALDDAGTTIGPALGGVLLALVAPTALLGLNAVTYAVSALILVRLPLSGDVAVAPDRRRGRRSLLADARAGLREVAQRPEVRVLLWSSTGVVLCIGVTSVGEVMLAREVLHVGGSGLALMISAGGVGMVLGSLSARFTSAGAWRWRQVYLVGVFAMALELIACSLLESHLLVVLSLFVGGLGNGAALVHDRLLLASSAPESLHGRLFSLQRMCIAAAFTVSFVGAGALITALGVRPTLLVAGVGLALVTCAAAPRLRKAWPAPPAALPADALA